MTARADAAVRPSSVLVTGADGFAGRHLMAALRRAYPDAAIHAAGFDLTDAAAVADGVASTRPDCCVHLAAISAIGEARADPDLAWRVNLLGSLSLARAILAASPACRLVHVSSSDAYGASFRAGHPLGEDAPFAPLNTYAATKAASELALAALEPEGLRLVRLRPFNHTGPGQRPGFVVAAFAEQIARIEAGLQDPVMQVGALDPARDFLDVRDVTRAYVACAGRVLPPGTVLNIASGRPRRIGDVLADMLRIAGVSAEIRTDRDRLRPTDIAVAAGDPGRAHAALDWAPTVAWEDTLAAVLDDWRGRVAARDG